MILFKTLIFTILVPGSVLVLVPWLVSQSAPPSFTYRSGGLRTLGLVPGLVGAAAYFRCAWDFATKGRGTPAPMDAPKALVAQGLYRYVRNPMYVGGLLVITGEAIWFESAAVILYGMAVFTMFHLFIVLYEEPVLRRKFGDSYTRYCARVPRWIPRAPGPAGRDGQQD